MNGKMDKIKGRIKQAVGDLTGNKHLKEEGNADELRGVVKSKIDCAAEAIKNKV